jgi:hypothetical protein
VQSFVNGAPPVSGEPPEDPSCRLEGLFGSGRAVEEPAVQLDEVGAVDDELRGDDPVGEAAEAVEAERAGHVLGVDGETLLGSRRAGVADREDRDVGLCPAVEAGGDVDERLVVEQLGGVLGRELRVAPDLDAARRRDRVGGELVDQQHPGCSLAEVFGDLTLDERRHLLAGACTNDRRDQGGLGQIGERPVDLLGELERCRRVEAQRLGRHAVEPAAVGVERRRADAREHQRRGFDRGRLPVEPVVDDVAGPKQASCRGDTVEHRGRIDGNVGGLGEALGAAVEECLADLTGPGERREDTHRLGDVVQDAGSVAIAIRRSVGCHRRILSRRRPGQA